MAGSTQGPRNLQEFEALFAEVSNWGRWGDDDERGALNLITPREVRAAVALVQEGITVNASWPLRTEADVENFRPVVHLMTRAGDLATEFDSCGDYVAMMYHGYGVSHIDALCHFFFRGQTYNGRPASVVTSMGARANAIDVAQNGIMGRGVLLDIPRARGVEFVESGDAIYAEDFDAAERAAGVHVGAGDILLVRTGRQVQKQQRGIWDPRQSMPGMHASSARWIRERDVAIVGCDATSDVRPSQVEGVGQPMHVLLLVAMGVHLLDNLQLEDLAEACASRSRWEFLLSLNPLRLAGGTGSPLNPIAVF
jgi:kynurenine formamidase